MLKFLPFIQAAVDEVNENSLDEISRLDHLNLIFKGGVFMGKAKNLPLKTKELLLESFSLKPQIILRRRKV